MTNAIFPGSFDPAHIGHLNTFLKAQKLFKDEIKICICTNNFKGAGLLTMNERLIIAKSLFPTNNIDVFYSADDITELLNNSSIIIRGFRNDNDKQEATKLLSFHCALRNQTKVVYIQIDKEYEAITSTAIKKLLSVNNELAKNALTPIGYEIAKSKFT